MPNRFLKESICTSENIDALSFFEETVFYRLMVNCDDFGRFDARPKILSSRLFPLKDITPEQMSSALKALVKADLITLYEVDGKPFLLLKSWDKHQQTRANKSKYPAPTDNGLQASDNNCYQVISDDNKCARITITNNDNDIRKTETDTETVIGDSEAVAILEDQNRLLNAAEDAGFARSNSVRAKLIDLLAEHGLEKVLDGINSCVMHGVTSLAYLEGCLKSEGKKPTIRAVTNSYHQRDYSSETEAAFERMMGMELDGS